MDMISKSKLIHGTIAATMALSMTILPIAPASAEETVSAPESDYTGWVTQDGEYYWFDSGIMARSKEIYDPGSDAWYWLDPDGTMAHDKDVYLSSGNKWVRYDGDGHMVKGEDYRYGGWYYFDQTTGAMSKGMKYIHSNGGKWVYYDWTTGKMAHGEAFVNYDSSHTLVLVRSIYRCHVPWRYLYSFQRWKMGTL
mgnify:FL=1